MKTRLIIGLLLALGLALPAHAQGYLKEGTYEATNRIWANGAHIDQAKAPDIASATTPAICNMAGNFAILTGTTTVAGFDACQAGVERMLETSGILQFTYNATSLILPNAANRTTAAGDIYRFTSLGSGNWVLTGYTLASGKSIVGTTAAGSAGNLQYNNGSGGLAALSMSADQVPVGATPSATSIGDCTDTGGNHLNYATATHTFSCGTSGTVGGSTLVSPNGRLTLQSGTPVMTADVTAASTIYYDCSQGGSLVPYYDGSADANESIGGCEVSDTMPTSGTGVTNTTSVFDLFWVHGGANRLCHATDGSGAGWAGDSATDATHTGSTHTTTTVDTLSGNVRTYPWWVGQTITDADGDIPGGTTIKAIAPNGLSITLSQAATASHSGDTLTVSGGSNTARGFGYTWVHNTHGFWTNATTISHCYNGSTDYGSITADEATYLGTIYTTAAGQTGMAFKPAAAAGGANNILGLWNAYNRVPVAASNLDSAADYTYSTATWRAADAGATGSGLNNRISWVDGLGQSTLFASYQQFAWTTGGWGQFGLVLDSTTAAPAPIGGNTSAAPSVTPTVYSFLAQSGFHYLQQVEFAASGTLANFGPNHQSSQPQGQVMQLGM